MYFGEICTDKAFLPSKFPVPCTSGSPEDWPLSVAKASEKELDAFLEFRGRKATSIEEKRRVTAVEAVKYRGEVQDITAFKYIDEKFTQKKSVPFPIRLRCWNGWNGFFAEIGEHGQYAWCGSFSWAVEHGIAGLVALYALYVDLTYIRVVVYIDMGFNMVDLVLMVASMIIKYDITVYSGVRSMDPAKGDPNMAGLFKLLAAHHFGGVLLESLSLSINSDALLMAEMAVAMLGTTGMLHFVAVLTDAMPIRENPRNWLLFTGSVLVTMVYYRGFMWVFYVYRSIVDVYGKAGILGVVLDVLFLSLFTLFNIDFIKFYYSKSKKIYSQFKEQQTQKKIN